VVGDALGETARALVTKLGIPVDKAHARVAAMRRAFPEAMVSGHEALIPTLTNHPKDRHVLAVAVHTRCETIVTADLAGFRDSALIPHHVTAVHPDLFLLGLANDDPDAVWTAVERKRRLYRHPPLDVGMLCDRLGTTVPRFASRLRNLTKLPDPPLSSSVTGPVDRRSPPPHQRRLVGHPRPDHLARRPACRIDSSTH